MACPPASAVIMPVNSELVGPSCLANRACDWALEASLHGPCGTGATLGAKVGVQWSELDPPGERACHLMRDGQRMQDDLCVDGDG
jgi:hypothetical protein